MTAQPSRIGLISDTHGLLRAGVFSAFEKVDLILHAGDVGGGEILDELETIAPVAAVYGNTDIPGTVRLTDMVDLEVRGKRIHVSHGHEIGAPTPERLLAAYDADVIVYGHTHRKLALRMGDRLVVNPGAAGAQRIDVVATVAVLTLAESGAEVEFIEL